MSSFLDIGPLQSGSGRDIGALQASGTTPDTITVAAGIPSGEFWGTPVIAITSLTVTLAAPIPSGEFWGVPGLNGQVDVGTIPTGEFWPTPNIITKLISLSSGIPTGESWGSPTLLRPDQFINVLGRPAIASGESWPTPTMLGGGQDLRLYLGGIDLTSLGRRSAISPMGAGSNGSAATITSQTIGRSTATFDYVDIGGLLVPGQFTAAQDLCGVTVKIVEAGITLFAGCIDTVGVDREMPFTSPACITYHIIALDKTSICDHRVVTGKVYTSGTDIGQVILDVVSNFLNGEGVTTQGVPIDGSLGTLDADTSGQYETVRQMFDELAQDSGTVWWIDQYGVLFFSPITEAPAAPFSIDETQSNAPFRNSAGTPMISTSVSGGSQTSGFRNKEYVVSNLNTLPGSNAAGGGGTVPSGTTETIIFTEGEPGVWDSPPGTPYGILASLPIAAISSLTVNGNVQTVYELSSYSGQTSTGPNDFLWAYLAGGTQVGPTFGPIPAGASIVITYTPGTGSNPATVVVGSASNPLTPTGPTFGHCGSGIFEVIDQVKNVSSVDDLNALAQSFLNRSGAIPQVLTFETDKPGLFVGQALPVYLPSLGVPRTGTTPQGFIISGITGTAQDWYLKYGSFFRWTVTAINNYDPANWITYFSRLVARTENALPVLQSDPYSWALGNGSAAAGGTSLTNPLQVRRTGRLVTVAIAAQLPPVNQTLVVQLLADGVIFATVSLSPSATPNVFTTITVPLAQGTYLYTGQVLTLNANYVAAGGIPVKAQGVTVVATLNM